MRQKGQIISVFQLLLLMMILFMSLVLQPLMHCLCKKKFNISSEHHAQAANFLSLDLVAKTLTMRY